MPAERVRLKRKSDTSYEIQKRDHPLKVMFHDFQDSPFSISINLLMCLIQQSCQLIR